MTRDEAAVELDNMERDRELNGGLCPKCAVASGDAHRPNCQWAARHILLLDFVDNGEKPMEGPNLKWGDPCGTYEIEIVPEGAVFFYRQKQLNGGLLEIKIPLSTQALAEMQAMLNMVDFGIKVEVPNGRIAAN